MGKERKTGTKIFSECVALWSLWSFLFLSKVVVKKMLELMNSERDFFLISLERLRARDSRTKTAPSLIRGLNQKGN